MNRKAAGQHSLTAGRLVAWLATSVVALPGATTLRADPPVPGQISTLPTIGEPSVSPGFDLSLQVRNHGGTSPFTYTWKRNGVDLVDPELHGNQLKLGPVEQADAGEYTVLVRNAEGEALSGPFTLEVDPRFRRMAFPELQSAMTAAWGDLNGDGWLDVVTAYAGHVRVHLNARDGTLPLRQDLPCSNAEFRKLIALADFNNDGHPDLVMSENWENNLRIYRNTGEGTFESKTSFGGLPCVCPSWVDLNADGYLDLFVMGVQEGSRPNFVILNQAGTSFRRWRTGDPGQGLVEAGLGAFVGWGDYNLDGCLDAAGTSVDGEWWVLQGDPAGGYSVSPPISGVPASPSGHSAVTWVDYDNDGDIDLLMGGIGRGLAWFLRNDDGVFTTMTAEEVGSVVTDPPSTYGLAWGDCDNDGDLDLYVARWDEGSRTGYNFFYENQGDGKLRRVRIGSPTASNNPTFAAYWADYDQDGFLDLHVPAVENLSTALFHNELAQQGNRNGWLQVRCEGRVTNRDGIGVTVRVRARIAGTPRWQMRQIVSSCSGQLLLAHFGLGDAAQVDLLRVQWPSGAVQEFRDVAINHALVVKEPPRLVPTGPTAFEVKCWPDMHFTVQASTDLKTWRTVGSVTHVNGTATFSDVAGAEGTCCFYRVVDD